MAKKKSSRKTKTRSPALSAAPGSEIPDDFGTKMPEVPAHGPRALTEEDLKGYTEAQWKEIIEEEKDDASYMAGVRRKGYLAHRRGKPRKAPYLPGKYTTAWLTGYDEYSPNET